MTEAVLRLPRLGETMDQGVLVAWAVAPGESYLRGDTLLEVETDKTVAEVPALSDGRLVETLVDPGAVLEVGTPIARVDVAAADAAALADAGEDRPRREPHAAASVAQPPGALDAPAAHAGRPRATPVARRLAARDGTDLSRLTGTGRRGRIEGRDVRAAAQRPKPGTIALEVAGPSDAPPLVFLHGFAADRSVWAGLAAAMVRAGRRTVTLDLPGHGATTAEAAMPEALADGLAPALAEAIGDAPQHLVAHSLGAVPALALASARMPASLTLIAPVGLTLGIDAGFLRGLARAKSPGEVAHLLERMTDGPLPLSPELIAATARTLAADRVSALADALAGPAGQTVTLRADLARLAERCPVRLILGHRDRIIPWEEALTVSPRIAVHHLPRAGHMPQWEALAEVTAILTAATEG